MIVPRKGPDGNTGQATVGETTARISTHPIVGSPAKASKPIVAFKNQRESK
jgi:hypothetical protein